MESYQFLRGSESHWSIKTQCKSKIPCNPEVSQKGIIGKVVSKYKRIGMDWIGKVWIELGRVGLDRFKSA